MKDNLDKILRVLLGRSLFGARLIKTGIASTLAVLISIYVFGSRDASIFAGVSAFAAVAPSLGQSTARSFKTLSANVLGGLWAIVCFFLVGVYFVQLPIAVFGGLIMSHRLLPGFESSALSAILAISAIEDPGLGAAGFLRRLTIVMIGTVTGVVVNALYPPHHLEAAREVLTRSFPDLRELAGKIVQSLTAPGSYTKEDIKRDMRRVTACVDEALLRLSYLDGDDPLKQGLRRLAQAENTLVDSLGELHRLALFRGGFSEEEQTAARALTFACLEVWEGLVAGKEIPPEAGKVLAGFDASGTGNYHLFPLAHAALKLVNESKPGTEKDIR